MKAKKSLKADLEKRKSIFFEIGLTISILLVIGIFKYSQAEKIIEIPEAQIDLIQVEIMEITRQEKPPTIAVNTKPIEIMSTIIKIVDNDSKITNEISFEDLIEEAVVATNVDGFGIGGGGEEILDDEIFITAEEMPKFQGGGLAEFRNWVQKRLEYPIIAREMGVQGKVTIQFVIEVDGKLTNILVLQTPDRTLSEEAVRVLQSSPIWSPGMQRNKAVRVKYTLPLTFKLKR